MRTARLAFVALCCALVGLTAVAVVAGAPPPTRLCGVCGFETLGEGGIDGATEPGTLDIYVDETGDSRWVARVPVTSSTAERYDEPAALEDGVDDAWTRYHVARGDVRDVESRLEDETIVVNYTVADVARPGAGDAWLLDYFATGTSNTRYRLVAQRVSIHTPDGTVVTNRPRYATVDGDTATWTARAEGRFESDFDDQTYVAYGPDGPRGTATGYATIGLEVGPHALEQGVVLGLVPGALLATVGLAVGRVDRGVDAFDTAELERLLVAVGVVGAIGLLVVSVGVTGRLFARGAGALSVFGVGYALLAIVGRRCGSRCGTRGLVGLSVLATVVAGATMWLLGGTSIHLAELQFGLATALFLPIGYAFGRETRPVGPILVAALAPIGAAAALQPVRMAWYVVVLYWVLLTPWIAAIVVFGYPLALLGRQLAAEEIA